MQGKYFIRTLKNLFHINKDRYVYKDKKNRKWAYISYIPRVYYKKRILLGLISTRIDVKLWLLERFLNVWAIIMSWLLMIDR